MKLVPGVLVSLALSLAAGCETPCTDDVVGAVHLTIEGHDGDAPEAYRIEASLDGDRLLDGSCGSQSACGNSGVGTEPGVYDIRIIAEGYEDYVTQIVVDATDDGCHPQPVDHTVILTPLAEG